MRFFTVFLLVLLASCARSDVKVLIGGTAVVAPGAQPISDAVVVIAGKTIRSVGLRKDIPVPQGSERTDVTGMLVVPAAGARLAPGESADLQVLDSARHVTRSMVAGQWRDPR